MQNTNIDSTALFNIGYGLYLVTSNDGKKDNGVIVNAVMQVTNSPIRVAVAINRDNFSHDVIKNSSIMNLNCLSEKTPFSIFENFGMKSGREHDKFKDIAFERSQNGLACLKEYTNSLISLKVEEYVDLGTHGMFICSVTEASVLSSEQTMTYTYYQKNVKPKPQSNKKKGFVCTVCGFVYEGETLPEDYVCPLCLHGAEYFEPIE